MAEALGIRLDRADVIERGVRAVAGEHMENSGRRQALHSIEHRARAAQRTTTLPRSIEHEREAG
jgi:hypothetical protein